MGSGGWQQQKCTHLCPPSPTSAANIAIAQTICPRHSRPNLCSASGWAAQRRQQRAGDVGCTGQLAFAFPNHLSFVRTQKWIWGPSILLGFWDHPPRTTAWGKPVKVTHRPSAPHSRAPSWTTGHHWVPPAVERLARKVGPKVLAPWSLQVFGPKEPNAPRAVPLFHTKCGGPGWQTPTPTGALSVPIVGETHLGQGKVGIARVTGWKGCGT